jgi:hypothetical protein
MTETRDKSIRAVILSAFVFPGAGQLGLGHKWTGIAFISTTIAGLVPILIDISTRMSSVLQKLTQDAEQGIIDPQRIFQLVHESATAGGSFGENLGLSMVVLCWVISILHAYGLGRVGTDP